MKKSIVKRIKITKRGKVKRQSMGLGHSRSNKRSKQALRRRGIRTLDVRARVLNKLTSLIL